MSLSKRTIYITNAIIALPLLVYLLFKQVLPQRLIIHFGPGAFRYTSIFNAMVLFPIFLLLLHQILTFKPDWLGMHGKSIRMYLIPLLMIAYYFFTFLLSGN